MFENISIPNPNAKLVDLEGIVAIITYYNAENGYSVIQLEPYGAEEDRGLITITGNFPELVEEEYIRIQGKWETHAKHGEQFAVTHLERVMPDTIEGVERFLASGVIKGIGPTIAHNIIEKFGAETLRILDEEPERLTEVPDIGKKRAQAMAQAWQEHMQVRDIMMFLYQYGITTNLAMKIFQQYGQESITVLQKDPYQMALDIHGVGFIKADQIAKSMGLETNSPVRVKAGLLYTLEKALQFGHVYLPQNELIQKAANLIKIDPSVAEAGLQQLVEQNHIVIELNLSEKQDGKQEENQDSQPNEPQVYLASYHYAEKRTAEMLTDLISNEEPTDLQKEFDDVMFGAITKERFSGLDRLQFRGVGFALKRPVSILTGGPGTGKTTTLKTLIEILEANDHTYALASPTGRAAKRLSEATGRPAMTIHRLLGYNPSQGFTYDESNPLEVDIVIIDEASMIDTLLFYHFLKAIKSPTHLMLVGDINQLPSVGAGDVLRNLIDSQRFVVIQLKKIFRQSKSSHIVINAHKINNGVVPNIVKDSEDFFRFPAQTPEEAADWIEDLVINRIPNKFGFDPHQDIQVLVPMYRGPAGVDNLNERLQAALNPPARNKNQKKIYNTTFREGDKVMQVRNDYEKKVFNGDIGRIEEISRKEQTFLINFDGHRVEYSWTEGDQFNLAYAISIHKSQGSEFPAIVIPILTQHYMMLQRNLLYTAVTRAKNLCVLVSNKQALQIAVSNNSVSKRYSALETRLRNALDEDDFFTQPYNRF